MYLYFSLLVCIAGAVVYLMVNDPQRAKLADLGRLSFAIGLAAFLFFAVGSKGVGLSR